MSSTHRISIAVVLAVLDLGSLSIRVMAQPAPDANSILILGSSVGPGPSIEESRAAAQGLTVTVDSDAAWAARSTGDFSTFKALVIGDPICGQISPTAESTRGTWGPAVTGNIVILGTDPSYHASQGGDTVVNAGIAFAAAEAGATGLYITLSCAYHDVAPRTPVPVLDPFGTFSVAGVGCFDDVHVVAAHPALSGLTDESLSSWGCSIHEAFDSFPSAGAGAFLPLAIGNGVSQDGSLSFPDGSFGLPYVLARGRTLSPVACGNGVKEASEGCDDGNTLNGDGCTAQCTIEASSNHSPDCAAAYAEPRILWRPNHEWVPVGVGGISDSDGDAITVRVTAVTQDEPVLAPEGGTSPDAWGKGDSSTLLRAERAGVGNGRVYHVAFRAEDGVGGHCEGAVSVCVPHDQRFVRTTRPGTCIDEGSSFDSYTGADLNADDDGDGLRENQGDCDDANAAIHPGAMDVAGNGIDEDCDGADGDNPLAIDDDGDGSSENQGDCDDTNAAIHPGAMDVAGNGIDEDCDGTDAVDPLATDDDADGFSENQGDCDDANASIHPGAMDVAGNDIDEDCDGADAVDPLATDDDADGFSENQGDCDDANAAIHPGATDVAGNGVDEDCDGADAPSDDEPIGIESVSFVKLAGGLEPGLFPISGRPLAGQPSMIEVILSGPVTSGRVDLLDISDLVLSTAPLEPAQEPDTLLGDYVARIVVPDVPFAVRVAGVDGLGRSVDLLWTAAFFPTPLEVRFLAAQQSASPGEVVSIPLRITNLSTSQTFQVLLTASPGTAVVTPSVLDVPLAASEARLVDLTVTMPSDIPLFSSVEVTVSVMGRTDPAVRNQSLVEIEAAP